MAELRKIINAAQVNVDDGEILLPEEMTLSKTTKGKKVIRPCKKVQIDTLKKNRDGRNWTKDETNIFCRVLADPINNFVSTLEKRALKKASTKEVFEDILAEFKANLETEEFNETNMCNFSVRKPFTPLIIDIKKLQAKYNNLKSEWRKAIDRKKNGSGKSPENEPTWFNIINPILADSNKGLEDVVSNPSETSFVVESVINRRQPLTSDEDSGSSSEISDISDTEVGGNDNTEHTVDQSSTPVAKPNKLVTKPHQKRGYVRSQTQAMSQLAASVNKLADVSSKKAKLENEGRLAMLKFKREEGEANRKHEIELASLYLRMRNPPNFSQYPNSNQNFSQYPNSNQNFPQYPISNQNSAPQTRQPNELPNRYSNDTYLN